jgi:pilus assembly protein CpaB
MRFVRLRHLMGGWPRRLLALTFLLLAALSAVHGSASGRASSTSPEPSVAVVVAAHDVAAGMVIDTGAVKLASVPAAVRPASAISTLAAAIGQRVAGPVGAGEMITAARLIGRNLTTGLPTGLIAVPVPLVDPNAAGLIRAGDHVDLLRVPADSSDVPATTVATAVLVLAVIPRDPDASQSSAQLVVAVDPATELQIAAAIASPMLATVIKGP